MFSSSETVTVPGLPSSDRHFGAKLKEPNGEEALRSIRKNAQKTRQYADLVEALTARGEVLLGQGAPQEAMEAWLEAALLAEEELQDLMRATRIYEKVLLIDPTQRRALFSLGHLLHDLGRWDDLIALYRRRVAMSEDEREQRTLEQYMAELLAEKKADYDGALDALVAAAARAPGNLRLLGRLEALGEQTGRLEEVAITVGNMILHQEDPQLRAALSTRLAELYLGPLDDPARALAHLRGALADDGGNPWVLEEIEDVFREKARFDELARLLEELLKDERMASHRARLERELARLYELELNDFPRAVGALIRAFGIQPSDRELLSDIVRIGRKIGMTEEQKQRVQRAASLVNNPLWATLVSQKLAKV